MLTHQPAAKSNLDRRDTFQSERAERIEALALELPQCHQAYTDKYFLRAREIIDKEGLNPIVRAQVFVRKGPGHTAGLDNALAVIKRYSEFFEHGGKAYALPDGVEFSPCETLLLLEGPLQDIIELETFYLGVLTKQISAINTGIDHVDLEKAEQSMRAVVSNAQGRPVIYFGARHWSYEEDASIGAAAARGGAVGAATDAAASAFGRLGEGTIPHVLENAFAARDGREKAVVNSTVAFDKYIDPKVRRIALIDYNNREIDDSLAVYKALGEKLYGVRVDTPGENVMQGGLAAFDKFDPRAVVSVDHPDAKYWYGNGVTITGVMALRKALDAAGAANVKIVLTSGFGDPEKVAAFVRAEEACGIKLFDSLGVGGIYPSWAATMDVVGVKDETGEFVALSKVGRSYRENLRLIEVEV